MKVSVVPIGNSKGIRIPKAILKLLSIKTEVVLDVKGGALVIHPIKKKPREGWDKAFKEMHRRRDDRLLIDDQLDLDMEHWEWS